MLADRVRMGAGGGPDDRWGLPGPSELMVGNMSRGFFGEMPEVDLITGPDLRTACGMASYGSGKTGRAWLKFALFGKPLFVGKICFYTKISHSTLSSFGCVYGDGGSGGTRQITIGNFTYKVRLLRGQSLDRDPRTGGAYFNSNREDYHGSEWNLLMIPLHVDTATRNWGSNADFVEDDMPYWGLGYKNADLHVNPYTLTQELRRYSSTPLVYKASYRCNSSSTGGFVAAGETDRSAEESYYGWRPVLEPIL